jgi:hypothetical protein
MISYVAPLKSNPGVTGTYTSLIAGGPCTIQVTAWAPVGGRIVGTFSGTVKASQGDTVVITNGAIDVTRAVDH